MKRHAMSVTGGFADPDPMDREFFGTLIYSFGLHGVARCDGDHPSGVRSPVKLRSHVLGSTGLKHRLIYFFNIQGDCAAQQVANMENHDLRQGITVLTCTHEFWRSLLRMFR